MFYVYQNPLKAAARELSRDIGTRNHLHNSNISDPFRDTGKGEIFTCQALTLRRFSCRAFER